MARGLLAAVAISWLIAGCGDGTPARPPADAWWIADAAIPADGAVGIDCRGGMCTLDEVCCSTIEVPPARSYYCVPSADLCSGSLVECDGPEDCAGGVCCADIDYAHCVAGPSDCSSGVLACHLDGDCPNGACNPTPVGLFGVCR